MRFELLLTGRVYAVSAEGTEDTFVVNVGGRTINLEIERINAERTRVRIDGVVKKVELLEETASLLILNIDGEKFAFEWPRALREAGAGTKEESFVEKDILLSPLPGVVIAVEVQRGEKVTHGTPIVVIEAMKMESIIRSDRSGRISEILVKQAESVRKGQPLVRFSSESK
jgi:biotin carboxyl carrier protein